jgi:hypothetical protein
VDFVMNIGFELDASKFFAQGVGCWLTVFHLVELVSILDLLLPVFFFPFYLL